MPRQVVGIPDRDNYGDPTAGGLTQGQLADWVVQRHLAQRAGEHHDVRFGTPETGMYSWAARKGLPAPGQRHLAVQQPIHDHRYKDFQGTIPQGYGAGTVSRTHSGRILLTKIEPNAVHFTTADPRFPQRYALIKPKQGKNWLMLNTTKTEAVPYEKVHYATIPSEKAETIIEGLQPGSSVQAKVDGAASLTKLYKDHVEVISYRTAKGTGHPIVHTERIFGGRPTSKIPPELIGSVLRGELYGVNSEGRAIPSQQLGGLLNSGVAKSIEQQKAQQIKLRNMVFDVHQLGSQSTAGMPYTQRLAKLNEILPHLPDGTFHSPEEAHTPEEAQALFEKIRSGQHPLTNEGVVIHPAQGTPSKIKFMDEHDVHIRGIFPGEGKYKDVAAGGFNYSHEPEGPIVGKVGTGLSDETRRDLWENQADYIGRTARVQAQQKFPSGALRAPSLIALHEDISQLGSPRQRIQSMRRAATGQPPKNIGGALAALKQAKKESDMGHYSRKHDLLRQTIKAEPQNFLIDSEQSGITGLTHKPTGFRIHIPTQHVPTELRAQQGATL